MSYKEKIKFIDGLINEGKFDKALFVIHNYVEQIFVNKFYSFKFLSLPELDKLCKKIALKTNLKQKIQNKPDGKKVNIYLATKLDQGGGHTKKILEFINTSTFDSIIIVSEIQGRSFILNFKKQLKIPLKCKIILVPNISFVDKYLYILKKLSSFNIYRIYLFNSHQDSILVSAASKFTNKVYFYHHGDHNPCLGVSLFKYHIDTTHSLNSICQNFHNNTKLYLLDKNYSFRILNHNSFEKLNVVSICKSNKINIIFLFHAAFISRLSDKFIHIGNLNLLHKFLFKFFVFSFNIFRVSNFKIYEDTVDVENILRNEKINLYLASFPNPAFLTLLEVSYLGIASIINKNYFNTLLNNSEFLDSKSRFDYDSLISLFQLLKKIRKRDVLMHQTLIMNSLKNYHNISVKKKNIYYDYFLLLSSYKRFLFLFSHRYYFRMIRRIFYL